MASSIDMAAQLKAVPVYAELAPSTIQGLMSMLNEQVLPTKPYFFSSATFIFLVFVWAFTHVISASMAYVFGARYTKMTFDQRRTSDIYVLNCFLTTAAAILQFACMGSFSLDFQVWQFNVLRIAGTLVAGNYIFEMIYRPRMRLPMLAHHILTLFLIMLSLGILYDVKNPTMLLSGNMLLFLATLEQPTFLALLFYRLRCSERLVSWSLKISSVQTILFKSIAMAGALAVWFKWQRHDKSSSSTAYDALLWICITGLYVTQWYGAIVTWKISLTLKKRYEAAAFEADSSGIATSERKGVPGWAKRRPEIKRRSAIVTTGPLVTIPNRISSIYSPATMPSTPLPLEASLCSTPELSYAYAQRNGPITPMEETEEGLAFGPCPSLRTKTPASSIYEVPRSQMDDGAVLGADVERGEAGSTEETHAAVGHGEKVAALHSSPVRAARRLFALRRKAVGSDPAKMA